MPFKVLAFKTPTCVGVVHLLYVCSLYLLQYDVLFKIYLSQRSLTQNATCNVACSCPLAIKDTHLQTKWGWKCATVRRREILLSRTRILFSVLFSACYRPQLPSEHGSMHKLTAVHMNDFSAKECWYNLWITPKFISWDAWLPPEQGKE